MIHIFPIHILPMHTYLPTYLHTYIHRQTDIHTDINIHILRENRSTGNPLRLVRSLCSRDTCCLWLVRLVINVNHPTFYPYVWWRTLRTDQSRRYILGQSETVHYDSSLNHSLNNPYRHTYITYILDLHYIFIRTYIDIPLWNIFFLPYSPNTYIHTYIHTYRHTDIQTYRHTDIQTYIQTYIQT